MFSRFSGNICEQMSQTSRLDYYLVISKHEASIGYMLAMSAVDRNVICSAPGRVNQTNSIAVRAKGTMLNDEIKTRRPEYDVIKNTVQTKRS